MEDRILVALTFVFSMIFFLMVNFTLRTLVAIPHKISIMKPSAEKDRAFSEYIGNYTAILHAVTSLAIGLHYLLPEKLKLLKVNSLEENCITAYSLGYYIVDTVLGIILGFNKGLMLFHHVECILSLLYTLLKQKYANPIIWALIIAEVSNPLLLIRNNLQKFKSFDKLANFVGIIFSVLFVITRTYHIHCVATPLFESEAALVLKLHCGLLWFVSLYWSYTIVNMITKVIYDMTNWVVLGHFYHFLRKIRKNKLIIAGIYGSFITVCFMRTIVGWNHAEIY